MCKVTGKRKVENANFEIKNNSKQFDILPKTVEIEWLENELIFNNALQFPKFSYQKDVLTQNLTIQMGQSAKNCGEYVASVFVEDSNFTLTNAMHNYTILPYSLTAVWSERETIFNGKYQAPKVAVSLPNFADNVLVQVFVDNAMNVGIYKARAEIFEDGKITQNYVLANKTVDFEIKPYVLELIWSNTQLIYNGNEQKPTAAIKQCDFAVLPDLEIVGGASASGKYVATARVNSQNFAILNPTCEFLILPEAAEFAYEDIVVQVSASDKLLVSKIECEQIDLQSVEIPSKYECVWGINLKLAGDIKQPLSANQTQNTYIIRLELDAGFELPKDSKLLYFDEKSKEFTQIEYKIEERTITFGLDSLGTICLVEEKNSAPISLTRYIVGGVSLLIVLFGSIIWICYNKKHKSNKNDTKSS